MADVQIVTVTLSDGTPVQVVAGTPLHELYLALAGFTTTSGGGPSDIDLRTVRTMAWFMTPHGPQSVIEPATITEFRRRDYLEITAQQAADFFAGAAEIPDVSFITGQELPAAMAAAAADEDSAFAVALGADPTFTGTVGLPGGASGNPRLPVNGAVVIDGAVAKNFPGGGDKVGYSFAAVIKGGFTGDTGGNPTFAWGANDFVITGDQTGDVAGVTTLKARETEMHLYTPGAVVDAMTALQLDCKIEAPAVGATVTTMFGLYITPIAKDAGAVTNAYALYIEEPTAGSSVNEAMHVNGKVSIVGPLDLNGAATFTGALTASGTAKFTGATANAQGIAAGAYIGGTGGGDHGINLADGTNTWGIDTNAGNLRFMKAGVHEAASLTLNGDFKMRGGIGFFNTAPTTAKPTVTGSRGGNAALASLLTTLATYGLIADGTSA